MKYPIEKNPVQGSPRLFPLPLVFWLFMTVLMKETEEKWLKDLYGAEYEDYCRRVNRPEKNRSRFGSLFRFVRGRLEAVFTCCAALKGCLR